MEFSVGIVKLPAVFTGIVAVVLVLTVFSIVKYLRNPKTSGNSLTGLIVKIVVLLVVGAVIFVLPGLNKIRIDDNRLDTFLITGFTRVSLASEDIIEARVVDWGSEPEMQPVRRNLGTGFGSYKEGRFTLRSGEKVLLYTNDIKVLFINAGERLYMFGPDDFEKFVECFNENIHEVEGMAKDEDNS